MKRLKAALAALELCTASGAIAAPVAPIKTIVLVHAVIEKAATNSG